MTESIIQKRFKEILNSLGLTYSEFIKKNNLQEWEDSIDNVYYGRSKDPRVSTLDIIASALGCSINCLLGKCSHTIEERAILAYYKSCGEHGKAIIQIVAKFEAISAKQYRESTGSHVIPCVVPQGEISKGIIYDTSETVDMETTVKEAHIGIKITSNDLIPTFCKGDVLLFENRFPKNGEYGAFYHDGRIFIRKYIEEEQQYRLKCLHTKNTDMIFKRLDCIEYMGTCIDVIR